MGNTETKINEAISTSVNSPTAVSISFEIVICVVITAIVALIIKYMKQYIKKLLKRQQIRNGLEQKV